MPDQQPTKTVVKFGVKQFSQETPLVAKYLTNGVVYAAAIANLAMTCFPQIPDSVKVTIAQYSGGAVVFAKALAGMFGIQIADPNSSQKQ